MNQTFHSNVSMTNVICPVDI